MGYLGRKEIKHNLPAESQRQMEKVMEYWI
jgi:hypothetical protein